MPAESADSPAPVSPALATRPAVLVRVPVSALEAVRAGAYSAQALRAAAAVATVEAGTKAGVCFAGPEWLAGELLGGHVAARTVRRHIDEALGAGLLAARVAAGRRYLSATWSADPGEPYVLVPDITLRAPVAAGVWLMTVWLRQLARGGLAWPDTDHLADLLGTSARTVERYRTALASHVRELGLYRVVPANGRTATLYYITGPSACHSPTRDTAASLHPSLPAQTSPHHTDAMLSAGTGGRRRRSRVAAACYLRVGPTDVATDGHPRIGTTLLRSVDPDRQWSRPVGTPQVRTRARGSTRRSGAGHPPELDVDQALDQTARHRRRDRGVQLPAGIGAGQLGAVLAAALPAPVAAALGERVPTRVATRVAARLAAGATAETIVAAATTRWTRSRLAIATLPGLLHPAGRLRNPAAVAMWLLAPSDCRRPECVDGQLVDADGTLRPCPSCAEIRSEARRDHPGPAGGHDGLVDVVVGDSPTPPAPRVTTPPEVAAWLAVRKAELRAGSPAVAAESGQATAAAAAATRQGLAVVSNRAAAGEHDRAGSRPAVGRWLDPRHRRALERARAERLSGTDAA